MDKYNYFDKQLDFLLQHQSYTDCQYYPCHGMTKQNCLFCYCPFYPCEDTTKGKWTEEKIWDCSPCQWIHIDVVVKRIFELFYKNTTIPDIKRSLVKDRLW